LIGAEDDPSWLGGPFSLVTFVHGVAPNVWSRRGMAELLSTAAPDLLLERLSDVALRIADVPAQAATREPPSLLGMRAEEYTISADVDRWIAVLEATRVGRPGLALAGRWLADNAPETTEVVFQHHDFRLGNVLFDVEGEPTAVLDWEFSGAGDPLCDIGYAAQPYSLGRLLRRDPSLRLSPDPTTWVLKTYAERSPRRPDLRRLRYFVALGIFKMAVALVLTADEWWRGRGGARDHWLELPILSLTDDLVAAIRTMP
jgi:aminoglycoside phosphotransferase (APT) family kinase protein